MRRSRIQWSTFSSGLQLGIALQQQRVAERVKRAQEHGACRARPPLRATRCFISAGRLLGERQADDGFAGQFGIGFEQMADALGDDARLARARAGHHQQRPFAVRTAARCCGVQLLDRIPQPLGGGVSSNRSDTAPS